MCVCVCVFYNLSSVIADFRGEDLLRGFAILEVLSQKVIFERRNE